MNIVRYFFIGLLLVICLVLAPPFWETPKFLYPLRLLKRKLWGWDNIFCFHYWPGGFGYKHTPLTWFDDDKRSVQVVIWKYKGGNKGLTFWLPKILR